MLILFFENDFFPKYMRNCIITPKALFCFLTVSFLAGCSFKSLNKAFQNEEFDEQAFIQNILKKTKNALWLV